MTTKCKAWDVPPAPPAQRDVTTSTIPTLTMSGAYDGNAPPSRARLAAQTISPVTAIVIPKTGHEVVVKSACAQQVLKSFLATPAAPRTGCDPSS